jgi:hypothetical protein
VADGPVIHRLVDGGAWANYPSLVFRDPSFLAWVDQHTSRDDRVPNAILRPTLGFVLGDHRSAPVQVADLITPAHRIASSYDLGITRTSRKALPFLASGALGTRFSRFRGRFVLIAWVGVTLASIPSVVRAASVWTIEMASRNT